MPHVHILERIDEADIPKDKTEVRAVFKILNEVQRLPWILQYYRAMGVKRFF